MSTTRTRDAGSADRGSAGHSATGHSAAGRVVAGHSAAGRPLRQGPLTSRPLLGLLALGLLLSLTAGPPRAAAQAENLINRISNERMNKFEERLTADLNTALSRYVSKRQYVMAVKVIWNPDVVPAIENPQGTPEQQKLPGFPIFVRAPDSPAGEAGTPPFVRLEVKVLIDETLPEYYERFVRKIVPIVARMDFNRGDQVVVLKETFPVLPKDEAPPPTLSEQELMRQLGETPPPGQLPPQQFVPVPGAPPPQFAPPSGAFTPQAAQSPVEAAQIAYDEGRYPDALRIVQSAFQRATTNRERGYLLGLEGSIYYTQGNAEAAREAWRRSVTYDPSNVEVHEVLNYLETQSGGAKP
jgi:tetratricopeptide (TPR) repeat protein